MEVVIDVAKKYLDSETTQGVNVAKTLGEIFASHTEATLAASTSVQGSTTALLKIVSELRAESKYIPIAIHLLHCQLREVPDAVVGTFVQESLFFLSHMDALSLHLVVKETLAVCHAVNDHLCARGSARTIIRTLRHLVTLFQPNEQCLTPLHAEFMQACVSGQMYRMGYEMVQNSLLLEIDPETTGLSTIDPPKYFYYAGVCCVGMRDYEVAMENFIQVLAMPGHTISAIAIAAYKKLILLSLLATGKKFESPKYIVQMVGRIQKDASKYEDIVKCFEKKDAGALTALLTEMNAVLQKDTNVGLSWRLQEALITQQIKTLSRTYITLSLEGIRGSVKLEDVDTVKRWLQQLSASGEVSSTINSATGMVHFNRSSDTKVQTGVHKLQEYLTSVNGVMERAREMYSEIIVSPRYIRRVNSSSSGTGGLGPTAAGVLHSSDTDVNTAEDG